MAVIWVDDPPTFSETLYPNWHQRFSHGVIPRDPEYYVKAEIELSRLEQTGDEEFRAQQILKPIPAGWEDSIDS